MLQRLTWISLEKPKTSREVTSKEHKNAFIIMKAEQHLLPVLRVCA
jgi:hypothetical protein